ncbi:hypothetical protein GCM10010112_33280 [Actinoplanes lobatus]|uniref:Uncharacterized protein n=1 Tax=Actinoplanes lobatus TaxID=113568 RepID=A0A7W7HHT2_9ACTN|nr:hypothetical protein [Actinoplanes lobatus]MBB4750775.1 hypothetical protein [Actinoplanes lobatus]GGN68655.1 hypothetical protein GCM10010112_33280 [Actinoplanes lobatus]GIE42218.1 hypothetical protein Alo02nite_51160 [Actinoplanes lobatus]
MSRARRRQRDRRAAPPAPAETTAPEATGWTRLSRWTKTWVALVATTAIATVVPGVIPYLSDRVLDLAGADVVTVRADFGVSEKGLFLAAAEAVATEPADPGKDPRFVPAGRSRTKVILEGKRSSAVTILDVRVEVAERKEIRTGTVYAIGAQGEGDGTELVLNLDAPIPAVATPDGGPYFAAKHISLTRNEIWVISILNTATRHEHAWRLYLRIRYRGAERELTVPGTFRMTAFAPRGEDYRLQYEWGDDDVIVRRDCAADRAACAKLSMPGPG